MKLRKQLFQKIITAIIFFILAILATILLKDVLMAQNPEYALPIITIRFNKEGLPNENQLLASYSWKFLTTTKTAELNNTINIEALPAAWEPANAPIEIDFSFEPETMKISRADENSLSFVETGGELITPSKPGVYTYKIEGSWGKDKSLVYYFKIRIPEQQT